MPIARTVARRVGSVRGFDADAAAYIRAVQDADGAALEPAVAFAINTFVLGCKADGVWSAIKSSCILMGARTLSGALTPLVGTAPTNNNFVSGDYDRKTGLKGNASTKYLNANRNINADGQNDQHLSVYVSAARTSGLWFMGSGFTDGIGANAGNAIRSRSVFYGTVIGASISGFLAASRTSSTAWAVRYSGANDTGPTTASSAPSAVGTYVFARNASGSFSYVDARIAFYSMGSSLTLANLDTRVSDLYTAIGAAIP